MILSNIKRILKNIHPDILIYNIYICAAFFLNIQLKKPRRAHYNYFRKQSQVYWASQNKYMQGMIALALSRTGDTKTSFGHFTIIERNSH